MLSKIKPFRLSLRALLILMAIACLWFAKASSEARRQKAAVDWIESNGGSVFYDWNYDSKGDPKPVGSQKPRWPKWLTRPIGDDYFHTVVTATFSRKTNLRDISMLANLTELRHIDLTDNDIEDISPLKGLHLKSLYIGGNKVTNLSPLSEMTSLEQLFIHSNGITDISALSQLTNLFKLIARENAIVDVRPLSNLRRLQFLDLSDNQITDVSALLKLPPMTSLSLRGNPCEDQRFRFHFR